MLNTGSSYPFVCAKVLMFLCLESSLRRFDASMLR